MSTDPDWTRGVRLDLLRDGRLVISAVVSLRDRPGQVNVLMSQTAELDGPHVTQAMWINPGDSGEYERESLEGYLRKVPGCGGSCSAGRRRTRRPTRAPAPASS